MLSEKEMVNDYLSTINASLSAYGNIIAQTDNEQLRQAFIRMRNADEARQRRIYDFAAQQGYYQPASEAPAQEIQQLKASFQPNQPMAGMGQLNPANNPYNPINTTT